MFLLFHFLTDDEIVYRPVITVFTDIFFFVYSIIYIVVNVNILVVGIYIVFFFFFSWAFVRLLVHTTL